LQADLAVSADSGQVSEEQPMLLASLRGIVGLQIDVRSAASDLHSGIMGGIAPNAIHALTQILASLRDSQGRIVVEGFHDDVLPVTDQERQQLQAIPDDTREMLREFGIRAAAGDPLFTPRERNWLRPTLEVNGIWGGYQGEGVKTVIPCEAHAKITCRLVANQRPAAIAELLGRHILRHAPAEVEVSLQALPGQGMPYAIPDDHPGQAAAARTLRAVYGREPHRYRIGATVPIAALLRETPGMDTVAFGFSQFDEGMHAPNEFFRVANFERGLIAFAQLLGELRTIR
jgi:acetylornithine deacetylase/succinyl-diaminopimelate desuccinylase-like protein